MATGRSSISSQLSHGRCGGDEGRLTHSPSGPRTLTERVLCSSPRHADHDTEDGGQSGHSEGRAAARQGGECYAGEEAAADEEPGLMTVTWRADVTLPFLFWFYIRDLLKAVVSSGIGCCVAGTFINIQY